MASVCRTLLLAWSLCGAAACPSPRGESGTPPPAPPEHAAAVEAAGPIPDAALELADAGAAPAPATPTTPPQVPAFDPRQAARSKIALIDAIDRGLKSGDRATLLASVPDGGPLVDACLARVAPEVLDRDAGRERKSLADQLLECQALTDWRRARRLALNFGTREGPYDAGCTELNRLERSELFYALGDDVYKLSLTGVSSGGGYAAYVVHCSKKRGSARDFERLRVNCPGRAWSRVTQSGGRCP